MQLILSKANFGGYSIAVLMVLDTFLYKVLSWSFTWLIRSELYCFGIRIQEIVFIAIFIAGAKLSPFAIYVEATIYLLW